MHTLYIISLPEQIQTLENVYSGKGSQHCSQHYRNKINSIVVKNL